MKFKRPMLNFDDYLIESLQDQEKAKCYLMVALEEYGKSNNMDALVRSLSYIAAAKGGTLEYAQQSATDTPQYKQLIKRNTKIE